MSSISEGIRPHVVCVPYPAQGHINPMLKLAKILHHKGFHVTFVNTHYNHRRLLKSRGSDSLDGLSDFRFETIPDGLPPSDADVSQDIPALCDSTSKTCLVPLRNLLFKLNDTSSSNTPIVTCIISDGSMAFTLEAAEEFGIPNVLFWTPSACGFLAYMHCCHLVERGLTPLKGNTLILLFIQLYVIWHLIACFHLIHRCKLSNKWVLRNRNRLDSRDEKHTLKDYPSFIRTTDENDTMLHFIIREVERASKASAIILNTFDPFEHDVLEAISILLPRIYTVGPIPLLADQIKDERLKLIASSLWKEEPGCVEWLNSKQPNSVVYVNFGSITVMTSQQLIEFAWGLANTEKPFLWIIRPDLVAGDSAILPSEFLTETKDRGMLASWCPQEEILKHPSIGGFLTHCGWNSVLESVCGGVPMISWPFFAEQQTNCRYSCTEWGIGMEIDNDVKRDDVEKLVRELMEGDKGKEMKRNVMEWKSKAEEAAKPGGSSYQNLDKLIADILFAGNV